MMDVAFRIENKQCPQCGSLLYRKKPCLGKIKEGFRWMLKCPRAGCGYMEGLDPIKKEEED